MATEPNLHASVYEERMKKLITIAALIAAPFAAKAQSELSYHCQQARISWAMGD